MKVKDLMTKDPIVVTVNDTLNDVVKIFISNRIDGAPVVDKYGKLISIITKTELMKAFVNKVSPLTCIDKISSKRVITINEDADIKDAWDAGVGRLPVVNENGNLVGILTRTDLSKRLLEKEVQESKEIKAILQSTNNGVIIVNQEGLITRCNPSAIRILDLDNKDIGGLEVECVLPELKLHETVKTGMTTYTEKIQFKDKELICDRIPLFKEEEVAAGVIVFKDSSDLQSTIDELNTVQQLSKKLDAVIESSYDGIYITDGQANTMKINKAYERITGVKREEMLGSNMIELEKSGCISESATLRVLKTRKTTTIHQKFRTGKNALVTSTPIFDKNGKISMVVTNVRDITELAKLKEQLEKNKELAQKYYSEIEEMRLQLLNTLHIVAEDEKMLETMRIAKRVAKVDTTVLLLGETGVGKEEAAKFIHKNSNRKRNQFIKINCGAIPMNLIESELFGYEKGAFTGANREGKVGLFEVANGGTLFLDEVGELPLDMQVKLLRALQEREIKRVGGTVSVKIDVRILAATNRDLEEMVKQKQFREDLYYRLNVVPINILPLRERRGDILPLVRYFLSELNERYHWDKEFSKDALGVLYEYDWPGNVRELKNIVERVFIMSSESKITFEDLPKKIVASNINRELVLGEGIVPLKDAVAKVEMELLDKAFEKYGNVRSAAKVLGIDASTFVRKRKKYRKMH
ncbi:sigma-54-dependent Fis family transcriptional regulator [Crassaminicella profunda]|uniref:sigma-54-dependent Fis family transcriptional regulator n=1 Tax=Crassaminicella profunda TaxID=1286698 RepID=UPI001CA6C554|nr:sigma-54-dependent Fis family transcriptional regulator [Crassaminicella profunda]QZY56281.1 sigma 54-interacting transcriptional regulator [Crassaminicella profunda]